MADKNTVLVVVLVIAAVLLLQGGIFNQGVAPTGDTGTGDFDGCVYQPTASYSTKDVFSSTIVSGTAYYRVNGEPATTTAASNVNKGTEYEYWVSNDTTYTRPVKKVAGCGVNSFTGDAWQNASVTLSGWDNTNSQVTTGGAYNISMGANAIANLKITYQGTAKKSAAPFGGVMVVEYNNSISSVTCSGSDLGNTGFHITFSPTTTTRTYKLFEFKPSLDDGSGTAKTINCQFLNGASAVGAAVGPGGSLYYVHFIPANYYVTNDGNIALDLEKYLNSDNTRTQILNTIRLTGYWG